MYPGGRPPTNLPQRGGSGQAEKQLWRNEEIELTKRSGAIAELGARSQKIADNIVDTIDTILGGLG